MLQLFASSIWQVLALGLLIGAGLPAVFALGIKGMAASSGDDLHHPRPQVIGRVAGVLCFAVVALAIVLGISIIVSSGLGYKVSFDQIVPTFVAK